MGDEAVEGTYLFVPPEESERVRSLGALWDDEAKCWYLGPGEPAMKFSRWLPGGLGVDEFNIASSEAYVAVADVACQACGKDIEVICIHCVRGTIYGEPSISQFTVSGIWAMDRELLDQLRAWPDFHVSQGPGAANGEFVNHCPRCGTPQDETYLHGAPGAPFFDVPDTRAGSVSLIALSGTVRLGGDDHFTVE